MFFLNPFTDWLINKPKSLVEIIPSEHRHGSPIVPNNGLNNKHISYDLLQLKQMHLGPQHDQWLRQLPFWAIKQIRRLRPNNKPTRNQRIDRQVISQSSANTNNLIRIKKDRYKIYVKYYIFYMQHPVS